MPESDVDEGMAVRRAGARRRARRPGHARTTITSPPTSRTSSPVRLGRGLDPARPAPAHPQLRHARPAGRRRRTTTRLACTCAPRCATASAGGDQGGAAADGRLRRGARRQRAPSASPSTRCPLWTTLRDREEHPAVLAALDRLVRRRDLRQLIGRTDPYRQGLVRRRDRQVTRGEPLGLDREVVAAQQAQRDVGEQQRPERQARTGIRRSVRRDGRTLADDLRVQLGVGDSATSMIRSTPSGAISRMARASSDTTCAAVPAGTRAASAARRTVPITVAPAQVASCAATEPTAPSTPWTSTVCPSTGPSAKTARCAVMPGMPSAAPTSSPTVSGRSTAIHSGTTVACAAVPNHRTTAPRTPTPRLPRRPGSMPGPRALTTPAPSLCGTTLGYGIAEPSHPWRFLTSPGFTPDVGAAPAPRRRPARAVAGRRPRTRRSLGPRRSYHAARISPPCSPPRSHATRRGWSGFLRGGGL